VAKAYLDQQQSSVREAAEPKLETVEVHA